jgi:hypothetical protein
MIMSERKAVGSPIMSSELLAFPFVLGKAAFDMGLISSISVARMAQVALQSADTALSKYIELTEQELKRSQRRETVKVE